MPVSQWLYATFSEGSKPTAEFHQCLDVPWRETSRQISRPDEIAATQLEPIEAVLTSRAIDQTLDERLRFRLAGAPHHIGRRRVRVDATRGQVVHGNAVDVTERPHEVNRHAGRRGGGSVSAEIAGGLDIEAEERAIAAEREQWNDGSNTLCVRPGTVIVYDRNTVTNRILEDHGIRTIEIPGSELGRGRGGPRCMSMPLLRDRI